MVRCQHVFSSVMFFGLHFHVEGHGALSYLHLEGSIREI